MAYSPNDMERSSAAVPQALALLLFFIPPWVMLHTKRGRLSPYIRYWCRVSFAWSFVALLLVVGTIVAGLHFHASSPLLLVVVLHVVMCVMGAFAATFNVPFGYVFVASLFCQKEWIELYRPWEAPSRKSDE